MKCTNSTLVLSLLTILLANLEMPTPSLADSPIIDSSEEQEFPYTLIVIKETSDVLSGPGSTHYATDRLPRGTKVEIYRHDPGGYLAIRPPEGSFSLVLASAVQKTTDPSVIEVKSKSTKAWIGSRLEGEFQPMWQLKLRSGELLSVVKKVEIPVANASQSETWYQVEPPRGEFRWIHKDNLGAVTPGSISSAVLTQQQLDSSRLQVDLMKGIRSAKLQADIASSMRTGWKVLETDPSKPANFSDNEAVASPSFSASGSPTYAFDERLENLDLSLSQMVLAPKNQWRLDPLQRAVDQLRVDAVSGEDLALANRLARKIIDFQKVQAESLDPANRSTSRTASLLPPNFGSEANLANSGQSVQYDGRGILRKLYTNGGVGPTIYALEDEQGKVTKTISPSSGVNLERFVGKPVGLFGRAGFNQRLNRPHLTAQRVVDLKRIR